MAKSARNSALLALAVALALVVLPGQVLAQEKYCRTVVPTAEPVKYAPIWNYIDSNKGQKNPGYEFAGVAFLGVDAFTGNLTTWGYLTATNRSNNHSPINSFGQIYLVQAHQLACDSVPLRAGERVVLDIPGLEGPAATNIQCRLVKWYYASGADGYGVMPAAVIPKSVSDIDLDGIQSIQIRELTGQFFVSCATLLPLNEVCNDVTYNASPLKNVIFKSDPFGQIDDLGQTQVSAELNVYLDTNGGIVAHASLIDSSSLNSYSTSKTYYVQLNGYPCGATALGVAGGASFRFDQTLAAGCPSNEYLLQLVTIDGAASSRKVIVPPASFDWTRFNSGLSATLADDQGNPLTCKDLTYTPPPPSPPPKVPVPPYTTGPYGGNGGGGPSPSGGY